MRRSWCLTMGVLGVSVLMAWSAARADDQPAASAASPRDEALEIMLQPRTESTGHWEVSIGADYSSGRYGALRATRVYFVPLGLSYRTGRWRFAADSGVLRVKGPLDYSAILDLTVEEIRELGLEASASASGQADTTLSATYGIYENFDHLLFVDAEVRLKLPTASRSGGLGTGKVAGDLQLDVIKMVGRWSTFASATYGFRPHGRDGRDALLASAGLGRNLTESTSLGALFEWRRAPDHRARDGRDVFLYLSQRMTDHVSVTVYGARSLISGGVETQAGFRFGYRWP